MDLPAGTSIVGFADEVLVVCAADDVRILELQSKRFLTLIESFVTLAMKTRELDGRGERNNGEGQ